MLRRESLGRRNRSGPELLSRGSWHIREEALGQFSCWRKADRRLTNDALERLQSCKENVSARPPLCLISFNAGRSLSRAAFVSLPSAFLQPLKPSQGLSSNIPGASTQQLRATPVSSAKRLSSEQSLLMQDL